MNVYHWQLNSNEQPKQSKYLDRNSKLKLAVLCFIMLLTMWNNQIEYYLQLEYYTPISIGQIIAFFLGCFSAYIGAKITLITAIIIYGITWFSVMIFIPSNILLMWLWLIIYSASLRLVQIEIVCLIFLNWPGKFVGVFNLILFIDYMLLLIERNYPQYIGTPTLLIALMINTLLIQYVFDPLVNETKTIQAIILDIKAVFCNLQVINFIFTIVLGSTVGYLATLSFSAYDYTLEYLNTIKKVYWMFSIVGVAILGRKSYVNQTIILFTMITIVVGSLLLIIFQKVLNTIGVCLVQLGCQLLLFYSLPALEVILINHGVQNVHIVSSFLIIDYIILYQDTQMSTYIQRMIKEDLEQALYLLNVSLICLILVFVVFIIIFYEISVYKSPIQQIFPRQAVAPEQNVEMLQNIEL